MTDPTKTFSAIPFEDSETFHIAIEDLKPRPKERARNAKERIVNGRLIKAHMYTPKATREYETQLKWHFRLAVKNPWTGPLVVMIRFTTRSRADADNLAKAVLDGGNKVLYDDDAQVTTLITEKVRGKREIIELWMKRKADG